MRARRSNVGKWRRARFLAWVMSGGVVVAGSVFVPSAVARASMQIHQAAPAPRSQPCARAQGPGPGYDTSIGNKANGKKICIRVGEKLLVVLHAPLAGPDWRRPHATPPGYLVAAPLTLMLVRGATGANFKAVRPGTVHLSSWRPACPPARSGSVACQAVQGWSVEVVVAKKKVA